ncbi:MAG: LysM peptidoglycan-binding domain-containing protein [Anaerolinea sp.]|nr:LysM peptidoglycan-binding domain-containing protein [Anaerolinea sp.]
MPDIEAFDKEKDQQKNKAQIAYELRKRQQGIEEKPGLARQEASAPKFIAEHKVAAGETLGAIAMQYYQSATKEEWMAIYEANKEAIGDNPGMIKVGQVLKIPELA